MDVLDKAVAALKVALELSASSAMARLILALLTAECSIQSRWKGAEF